MIKALSRIKKFDFGWSSFLKINNVIFTIITLASLIIVGDTIFSFNKYGIIIIGCIVAPLLKVILEVHERKGNQYLIDIKSIENNKFILFLRSFISDHEETVNPFSVYSFRGSDEEILVQHLKEHAPIIAFDEPTIKFPPLGAFRIQSNLDWQNTFIKLVEKCKLIIIRVGQSESLFWELEMVLKKSPEKVIFFLGYNNPFYFLKKIKKSDQWKKFYLKIKKINPDINFCDVNETDQYVLIKDNNLVTLGSKRSKRIIMFSKNYLIIHKGFIVISLLISFLSYLSVVFSYYEIGFLNHLIFLIIVFLSIPIIDDSYESYFLPAFLNCTLALSFIVLYYYGSIEIINLKIWFALSLIFSISVIYRFNEMSREVLLHWKLQPEVFASD